MSAFCSTLMGWKRQGWASFFHGEPFLKCLETLSCSYMHKKHQSSFNGLTRRVAQTVKNLPAIQETWVQFLGWEDPLEKGKATHSSILAWRIPRTEEPAGLQSMESQKVRH